MRETIAEALAMLGEPPRLAFICGATAFVEVAAMFLVEAGMAPARVRTERYGGSPAATLDGSVRRGAGGMSGGAAFHRLRRFAFTLA